MVGTNKLINCTQYLPSLARLLVPSVIVILTRCRIVQSRFTYSYLLNTEYRPECILCYCNYSLRYILIDFEPYRWWNDWRARLECGRSWVRETIRPNERLCNWYLLLLRYARIISSELG
jgi:hypothetical protein